MEKVNFGGSAWGAKDPNGGVRVVGFVFAWGVFGFGCLRWEKGCRRLFWEKSGLICNLTIVILQNDLLV